MDLRVVSLFVTGQTVWTCVSCDYTCTLPGGAPCCWPHCCNRLMIPGIDCGDYYLRLVLS